ncbi:MAG: transketolase [Candidatus Omnitrophica bacterium]|nr:transketolase [Candidatus Omnitrophota bacterium]
MNKKEELERWAQLLRYDVVRMISNANSGHPGGSLSAADIAACLYFNEMNIRPDEPDWPDRDRFILSKGHAAPVLYAALARKGYFSIETLKTLRTAGSMLQGHPDIHTPGVDMTTGCLGQGLSAGCGMALSARLDKKSYRVYVMMGCGEMNEGQVWESVMSAAHFKLDNILVILDYNQLQFDGSVREVLNPGSMKKRWEGFNWNVIEINGHDINEILSSFKKAKETKDIPTVIIADTIKGRGVKFIEKDYMWHSLMDNKKFTEYAEQMREELKNADSFYADRLW